MHVVISFEMLCDPPITFEREFDLPFVPIPGCHLYASDMEFTIDRVGFVVEDPKIDVVLKPLAAQEGLWELTAKALLEDGWECDSDGRHRIETGS